MDTKIDYFTYYCAWLQGGKYLVLPDTNPLPAIIRSSVQRSSGHQHGLNYSNDIKQILFTLSEYCFAVEVVAQGDGLQISGISYML